MSEMLERVARAMHTACLRYYSGEFKPSDDPLETHRFLTAAAFKEMREPTASMELAGGMKCEAMMFEGEHDGTGVVFKDMGHVWRAMVDDVLKDVAAK